MSPLLLILLVLILFGGLGFHSGWGYYGAGPYGGIGSLLVIILVIWFLIGR